MKILLITSEYPPIVGGVSSYLEQLYSNLDHEVTIIAPPAFNFQVNWMWPRWLPLYFQIKEFIKTNKPDQIHISHVLPMGQIAYWILKQYKIPYVIIFHGLDLITAAAQPKKWMRVEKIVAHASALIVNSNATGDLLKKLLPHAHKPIVIRPGVQIRSIAPRAIEEFRSAQNLTGHRIILFLARLVPRKGVVVAVEAFYEIVRQNVEATLIIAGDGPERVPAEAAAARLGISDRIRFVGPVCETDKYLWYAVAHVFWFPAQPTENDWEGFGMTALEAQSFSCPVVVSNCGGLPETLMPDITGFVAEGTPQAFAEATLRTLNDASCWQRMRMAARTFAASQDWSTPRKILSGLIQSVKK